MMRSIFFSFLITACSINLLQAQQRVGIGTTAPVAQLEIRGAYQNPIIPGATSTGFLRLSGLPLDGIDIGKMSDVPYAAWMQAGYNGTADPLTLQPVAGNVGIGTGTSNPPNKLTVSGNASFSGNVSIGIIGPEISAAFEVNSTTKGFLPPRMTSAARNAIQSPVAGLLIWCTNCGQSGEVQVHNGSAWTNMMGGAVAPAIGDNYGGGKVAYILQQGDIGYIPGQVHGLISALADLTMTSWGCPGINIQGADNQLIGCGLQNTIDIVNGCAEPGIAARKCLDLVLNGFSDWYLPSKDELNKLYLNRIIIGGFSPSHYWSSTELDSNNAGFQDFATGIQDNGLKPTNRNVRPMRSF